MASPLEVTVSVSSEKDEFFNVEVVTHSQKSWKVQRLLSDFQSLVLDLHNYAAFGPLRDIKLSGDCIVLQSFLRSAIELFDEKVWFAEPLISFLENAPKKSVLAELQIAKLAQQIEYLTRRSAELEASQQELQSSYMELVEKMKSAILPSGLALNANDVHSSGKSENVTKESESSMDTTKLAAPRLSLISVITTDSATDTTVTVPVSGQTDGPTYMSDDDAFNGNRSPLLSGDFTPTPIRGSLEPIPENDESSGVNDVAPSLPNSPYLPVELLPLGDRGTALDSATDGVLKMIAPTEEQIQHRNSIVAMLRRQLRIALGATAFEIGLPVSRCLLPDDPIKMTVVISKALIPTWHTQVCDQLTNFAEKVTMYGGSSSVPIDEDEVLDPYFTDCNSYGHHHLGSINHSKQNLVHTVHLVVDNVPIEISANSRSELCMLALFEEAAQLVDQDNLLKRSFLLIRAWWAYETQAFVGCSIRHYLTDNHLFVMLLAIFNRYNSHIQTPLHAMSLFLAEYSTYDGSTQAISLQGLVPFQTRTSNQPQVIDPKNFHVMKRSIIEKHWMSYNIGYANNEPETTIQKKRSTSSEEVIAAATAGSSSPVKTPRDDGSLSSNKPSVTPLESNVKEIIKSLSANNIFFFERHTFNILHPLNHTNMIVEKLSQRRISKLYKAFQIGATNFAFYLKRAMETGSDAVENIRNYFPTILTHGNMWNKSMSDLNLNQSMTTSYELSKIEIDVAYCNLMIESIVSDQALQVLAMEILAQKGPLPVGEIGKILAELTSIPNLSLKLKEKFGGLKKFLEQYPASFVVSNDHPFNPNVLLRCSLSPEHLELIDKGIFPHQLLIKAKKAAAATAKKKKSHSIPLSAAANQYTNGGIMDGHGFRNTDNMMGSGLSSNYGNAGNNISGGGMNGGNMNMGGSNNSNSYRDHRGNINHNNMMMSSMNMNMGGGSGGNNKMNMMNMNMTAGNSGKGNNNGLNVVGMNNGRSKSMSLNPGSGSNKSTGAMYSGYGSQDMSYGNYHHGGHNNYMDDHGSSTGGMNAHGGMSGRSGRAFNSNSNNSLASASGVNPNASDYSVSSGASPSLLSSVAGGVTSTNSGGNAYMNHGNGPNNNVNGNSSSYFDDFLGNTSGDSNFSNQFLSQLRGNTDPSPVELSPRGYMDNFSAPSRGPPGISGKGHNNQAFIGSNSFGDASTLIPSLGGAGNGPGRGSFSSTSEHGHSGNGQSNYSSVIGNLFPLVLSPEEMGGLNFGNGSSATGAASSGSGLGEENVRDYSSLF